ncbi:fruit-specific protein-like [Lycium barbarum]|uniref:fruit-specific protein-like n=1 Tax=Lycium barbarum TaxID=112863 RepID=UPI00293E0B4D|nr:fruit-specific protein-like [Lycium barbarum]
MAGAPSSLNLGLVFKVLLVIVVLTWSQVIMAMRDMPEELKELQQRLTLSDIYTCGKHCNTNADCSEAWVCKTCRYFGYVPTQCDYVWSF